MEAVLGRTQKRANPSCNHPKTFSVTLLQNPAVMKVCFGFVTVVELAVERLWRSVKHEDICLNGYATMGELLVGLTKYFAFYNTERPHQSLDNQTPQEVHQTSSGGGAMIVDKYRSQERFPVALRSSETAAGEVSIEIEPAIQKAKTGAAPTSCEKWSAT
jgi:putative transposase